MGLTHSESIALAAQACAKCFGLGTTKPRSSRTSLTANRAGIEPLTVPCRCVYRAIFRACYEQFLVVRVGVPVDQQQFAIDFQLVAKRSLNPEDYKIFDRYFLRGEDWRMGKTHSAFYRHIYRIEELLGKVFLTLEPHPLYPVNLYFNDRLGTRSRTYQCPAKAA